MKQTLKIMSVVTLALFTDGLLYGLIIPLLPYSPANLSDDWMYEILSASYAFGVIIATPVSGFISDRMGRRYPMLAAVFIQSMSIFIFATSTHFYWLVIAKLMQGIAASTTWSSGLALITDHFTGNRAQMLGYALLGNTIGLVIGPLLGGFLFEKFDFKFPFIIAACFMSVDIFLRFKWVENIRANVTVSIKEVHSLIQDKTILVTSIVIIMGAWCWCVLESLFPLYLKNNTFASSTEIGALFTISCLIYGLSCPAIGYLTDRFGSWKTMIFGLFFLALAIPLLCFSTNLLKAGIALTLANIAYGFALNPTLSELSTAADRKKIGAYATTYAIYNVSYSFGMFGSNLTNGMITHFFSIPTTFFFVGIVMLLCIFIFVFAKISPKPISNI